ncbi:class I SAM-dependent methyltransferase [Actinomadura luteofluorescens]|uniref:class I SAM-dependent methyltransferase n=1 Tax=Actinomadura luteofluorescens TaxID=46163 RepID=UPI0036429E20
MKIAGRLSVGEVVWTAGERIGGHAQTKWRTIMACLPLLDSLRPFIEKREPVKPTAGDGDGHLDAALIPSWRSSGDADRYRGYQAAWVTPFLGRSVLDAGAQTGELVARIVRRGAKLERLVLTDHEQGWVEHLRRRFTDAEVLGLSLPGWLDIAPVDTVLLVNVLGHLEHDVETIAGLGDVLVPGGRVVVWEAGYPELFSDFDRDQAGRLRRYTPEGLAERLRLAGLEVEISRPVNLLGGLFNRVMVGRTADFADPRLVRLYDRLVVPLSRLFDRLPLRFGQNVFAVARVPAE